MSDKAHLSVEDQRAMRDALRDSVQIVPDPRDARIAALEAEVADIMAKLRDPVAVHVNALRGTIDASVVVRDAYARGAAAMRERAAAALEAEKPDVTEKSSLITQGKALGIALAVEIVRALPVEETP